VVDKRNVGMLGDRLDLGWNTAMLVAGMGLAFACIARVSSRHLSWIPHRARAREPPLARERGPKVDSVFKEERLRVLNEAYRTIVG